MSPERVRENYERIKAEVGPAVTVVVATIAVNIAANVVSPANDFANAFPRWISFRTGGLITGILGILSRDKLLRNEVHAVADRGHQGHLRG